MTYKIYNADFLCSAVNLKSYPSQGPPEIVFAGRSNVGKSSLINCLINRKKIARVSNTPGRTQQINFFSINKDTMRLVDLPGYGFSRVPYNIKSMWNKIIETYILTRETLAVVVIVVDIRHNIRDSDLNLINWLTIKRIPIIVVATKSDKLSNNEIILNTNLIQNTIKQFNNVDIFSFSSIKKTKRDIFWKKIWNYIPIKHY